MKPKASANLCVAGLLACGVAAFAQSAGQQPTPTQTPPSGQTSTDQQITVTGCVQREADYRRAREAGRGGVAGTGVGVGNEFVLTEATTSTRPTAGTPTSDPSSPTGTAGSAAAGAMAYELTGPNEGQVSQHVGRRVEITGKLKAAERDTAGRPTGGATAGQPPTGDDVTSRVMKLRQLDITSVRETTGTCTPMK